MSRAGTADRRSAARFLDAAYAGVTWDNVRYSGDAMFGLFSKQERVDPLWSLIGCAVAFAVMVAVLALIMALGGLPFAQ